MAWKYKRGGVWWIGYRLNDQQFLRSTKSTDESEADREIARLEQISLAHKAGNLTDEFYRIITNRQATAEPLTKFAKQWITECKDLSSVTVRRYREVIDEFCRAMGSDEQAPLLRDIRPEVVGAFLRKKRASTSTATAKLTRRVLSAFFNYSVDNQVLQVSPVPSARSLKLTKDSEPKRRAFTLAELKLIYEKAATDFWRYMILAGFYCGQRMGDLITLPWGAVDFDRGQINLKTSKTGKSLHIPLRAELRAFLLKLRPKDGTYKGSDPIWPEQAKRYEQSGAGSFSNEFYDDVLLPAGLVPKRTHHAPKKKDGDPVNGRAAKREVKSVSFHCLRHTFVSLLKVTGGSQAVAKELAGHSSDAVSDLYTHVPEEALTKAIEKLPEVTK